MFANTEITQNLARTGKFHGRGRSAEDAYYAYFGAEPVLQTFATATWLGLTTGLNVFWEALHQSSRQGQTA